MEKVIISGLTGFIGSHLSCYLLKANPSLEIFGLSRKKIQKVEDLSPNQIVSCRHHKISTEEYLKRIKFVEFDLTLPKELDQKLFGAKCFFHCAAQIVANNGDEYQHSVNVKGTEFISTEVKRLQIKSLLYISSVAAHDSRFQHLSYFNSKNLAEKIVESLPNANILIPGIVLGAGDLLKDSRKSYKLFYKTPFPLAPTSRVSFTDVHDLCKIALDLGFSNQYGNKFFVCPIHMRLFDIFKIYRKLSIFRFAPLFPMPKFKLSPKLILASADHIYYDNVPNFLRKSVSAPIENLIQESLESIRC